MCQNRGEANKRKLSQKRGIYKFSGNWGKKHTFLKIGGNMHHWLKGDGRPCTYSKALSNDLLVNVM